MGDGNPNGVDDSVALVTMDRFKWIALSVATAMGVGFLYRPLPSGGQPLSQVSAPLPLPTTSHTNNRTDPRTLTFTLTLSDPEDLKVRQGDSVSVGDTLADRTRHRQRLQDQHQRTQLSLKRIQHQQIVEPPLPQPVPPVAVLPSVSYATEETAIAEIQGDIDLQTRKIDLLGTLPPDQVTPALREHEDRVLERLYRDLETAEAGLKEAQEARRYQEYEYSLAMANRAERENQQRLSYSEQLQRTEQQKRDKVFQIAQLEAQLQSLDNQLSDLSTVRSPYSGTIRRIKWLGQEDTRLTVEITLAVAGGGSATVSPADNGSAPGG